MYLQILPQSILNTLLSASSAHTQHIFLVYMEKIWLFSLMFALLWCTLVHVRMSQQARKFLFLQVVILLQQRSIICSKEFTCRLPFLSLFFFCDRWFYVFCATPLCTFAVRIVFQLLSLLFFCRHKFFVEGVFRWSIPFFNKSSLWTALRQVVFCRCHSLKSRFL